MPTNEEIKASLKTEIVHLQALHDSITTTPQPTFTGLRLGTHKYTPGLINPSVYKWHDLQRSANRVNDIRQIHEFQGEALIFATVTTKRPSDTDGFTTGLPPSQIPDSWLIPGVKRFTQQEDFLVNIGNPEYREKATTHLVNEVLKYGSDGVYIDEVDRSPRWGYPTAPTSYSDSLFQQHWLQFLNALSVKIKGINKKVVVNLGDDYWPVSPFTQAILDLGNVSPSIEFFVGREGHPLKTPATLYDMWELQTKFVHYCEHNMKLPVHVHASTTSYHVADYAMCSYLLFSQRLGSFSASIDYGTSNLYPTLYDKQRYLGKSVETSPRQLSANEWVRSFEGGSVYVKPTRTVPFIYEVNLT